MENLFMQFGIILLVVLGVSIVMRILKQPLIMGYILSGILVGPILLDLTKNAETLSVFAEMGIAFLLFIVGLHLSPKVIKDVGKASVITGLGQILFTFSIGFVISNLLGFDLVTSAFIAIAVTFSSTIIIMKLLSDKEALNKLYGKVSIGFLLVQDVVAIFALIVVSSLSTGTGTVTVILTLLLKAILLLIVLTPITLYVLPKFHHFFAKSQEFLFIFAITWGFALSLLFVFMGFTIEVGALVAGIMLSMSPYNHEISSRLKPLRDFFLISFFIVLGSQMTFANISGIIIPALILSAFVLIGNPTIVMTLMGLLGYSKKTGFMAGLTVAQISEFSLILITLGAKTGRIAPEILSLLTLVALITIAGSTYMILYSDAIYNRFHKILSIFEKKRLKEKDTKHGEFEYVLLGYNTIGFSIIKAFKELKKKFLVVDYDPEIIKTLKKKKINAAYGDVDDIEFLDELDLKDAKLIVSTIPDRDTNELVLEYLDSKDSDATKLISAREIEDAYSLYESGADYVILPYFLGGEFTSRLIKNSKEDKKKYSAERKKEKKTLKERLKQGHRHPQIERTKRK